MSKNERNDFTGDDEKVSMDGKSFDEAWKEAKALEDKKREEEKERKRQKRQNIIMQAQAEEQARQQEQLMKLKKRHEILIKNQQTNLAIKKQKLEIKRMEQEIKRMKSEPYRKVGRTAKSIGGAFVQLAREQKYGKKQVRRRSTKRKSPTKKLTGYYCPKCRGRHSYSSKIGRRHRKFKR